MDEREQSQQHSPVALSTLAQQFGDVPNLWPVPNLINRRIHFNEGQFAGKLIRAQLRELQAPEMGRK
jgi:hypothetical protein